MTRNAINQYPESHSSNSGNVLYFTSDVTKLPHYYGEEHFLWTDIQLDRTSTSRNKTTATMDGQSEDIITFTGCPSAEV